MGIALLLSLIALAAVLLLRYRRGRALSQAASQLKEARNQPGKRLRLAAPDRPVEELLAQINGLLEERSKGGPFTDFMDFCDRVFDRDLNRRVLESLIKSGSFDRLVSLFIETLEGIKDML